MTYLSEDLKYFYIRKGNKLLFLNRISLNELAMRMWEKLNYRSIDASILSKVINGKMLFNADQLDVFSDILKLSEKKKDSLKKNLIRDIVEQKGLFIDTNRSFNYQFLFLNNLLPILIKLRHLGQPEEVIRLTQLLRRELQTYLIRDHANIELKTVLGSLYNEEARAAAEIASTKSIIYTQQSASAKAIMIGQKLKNREIIGKGHVTYAGVYYLTKRWSDAAEYFESVYDLGSDEIQMEYLRTLLLSYAKLKDYSRYKIIFGKSIQKIEKYFETDCETVCSLIEAMSRSLLSFNLVHEAKNTLSQVENIHISPFHKAQIIRCKTQILYKEFITYKTVDKEEIKQCGNELFEDKYTNFHRHKKQVNDILKKLQSK